MTPPPTALEAVVRLQGLLAAVPSKPWENHDHSGTVCEVNEDGTCNILAGVGQRGNHSAVADLIVALRNAAPALLSIAEAAAAFSAGGHSDLCDVWERNGDFFIKTGRPCTCGHDELAKALAEFARAVGP